MPLADGTCFWHFFNSWSEICRTSSNHVIDPPVFDRWFVDSCSPPLRLPFSNERDFIRRPVYTPVECAFHFSAESVANLRPEPTRRWHRQPDLLPPIPPLPPLAVGDARTSPRSSAGDVVHVTHRVPDEADSPAAASLPRQLRILSEDHGSVGGVTAARPGLGGVAPKPCRRFVEGTDSAELAGGVADDAVVHLRRDHQTL
ncbi:unnamed protein product [Musa textilis]